MSVGLVGFIFQHGKDDYTLWSVDLPEHEREIIENILVKYDTRGFSVRGNSELQLKEVL